MKNKCIYNGKIILPNKIQEGYIIIKQGRIFKVGAGELNSIDIKDCEMIDAQNMYVLPGLIDIHNDAIEKEIEPRPNVFIPFNIAFYEYEKKLATSGITSIYHSLSLGNGIGIRKSTRTIEIINDIKKMQYRRFMLNHHIHLRYDMGFSDGFNTAIELINLKVINYLSLVNNSNNKGIDNNFVKLNWLQLQHLIKHAKKKGINVAVYNENSYENIKKLVKCGVKVIEFASNLDISRFVIDNELFVCQKATGFITGEIYLNKTIPINEYLAHSVNIICSDYYISALLPAVFKVGKLIDNLPKGVCMATLNAAKAIGIETFYGSIEVGKRADILLVEIYDEVPMVRQTFIKGECVFNNSYFN